MPFSAEAEALRLSPSEAAAVRERLAELARYLEEKSYKAVLRDDSRLAFNWATGQVIAEKAEIAEEMSVAQFLHDATTYHSECETGMRAFAEEAKRTHPKLSWKEVWDVVRVYGADIVKYDVVGRLEDGLPEMVENRFLPPNPVP